MSSNDVRKMIDAAVESALARLRPELVESVLASIPAPAPAAPSPVAASAGAGGGVDCAALRHDLFAAMDGNGQVEILNTLMGTITAHWDRAVLFLVKGNVFQPWDARGFEKSIGNDAAKHVAVASDQDTILSASLSGEGSQSANHLLEKLGTPSGLRAAVPLGIRGKAAAVLYVDGPKGSDSDAVAAMEILARVTAQSIELGMFSKRTPPFVRCEAVRGVAAAAAAPAPAAPAAETAFGFAAPAAPAVATVTAEPEVAEVEVEVEVEEAPAASSWAAPAPAPATPAPAAWPAPPAEPEPAAPAAAAWPAPAPTPAPAPAPAAMAPPPAPAPAAAPATAAEPEAESGTLDPRELLKGGAKPVVDAGQSLGAPKVSSRWKPVREQMKTPEAVDPTMAAIPEADRAKHIEARKIARLLVSEIKLYNEAKVAVGRKNKDLYERLKEDIERSRQTYLQRIDPDVAAKSNYFQDELVTTLAEGDAEVLGAAR